MIVSPPNLLAFREVSLEDLIFIVLERKIVRATGVRVGEKEILKEIRILICFTNLSSMEVFNF